MRKNIFTALFGLLALFLSYTACAAEEAKVFGNYKIYYNTAGTKTIPVEVARNYGIIRSVNRALLNVTVKKVVEGNSEVAVLATVKATATNLNKQMKSVDMQRVQEGDAIYYIGVFTISNADTLDFVVSVDPENKGNATEIAFRQEFFVD